MPRPQFTTLSQSIVRGQAHYRVQMPDGTIYWTGYTTETYHLARPVFGRRQGHRFVFYVRAEKWAKPLRREILRREPAPSTVLRWGLEAIQEDQRAGGA